MSVHLFTVYVYSYWAWTSLLYWSLQVNHSQRLSEKPLTPWVVAEPNGRIVSDHCTCMAGLGECCSHVASLLWACEAGVRIRDYLIYWEKKKCHNRNSSISYAFSVSVSVYLSNVIPIKYFTVLWCLYCEYVWARANKFVGRSINTSKQSMITTQRGWSTASIL